MEAAALEHRQLLPTNLKPAHYELLLKPDLKALTYSGEVSISLDILKNSDAISLHTLELKINAVTLQVTDTTPGIQAPHETKYDKDSSVTTFTFQNVMRRGFKAVLSIKFDGELNDENAGFFRSSYIATDGTKRLCAYTHMEPTFARRAFPCFDEPALKATFKITLIVDSKMTCLSNMNVISESDLDSGKKMLSFATTPLMSTFLVAIVVCELEYIETDAFHVPIRVYALPGQENDGKYALDLAVRTLHFYEEAFQIPFPLPKMDMVAVPDFSGAMENWGLIIFKSNDLLFNEMASSANDKQRVAENVQHELAHMWFGNLVTMDFWDGLWLKEGFATWMSWYSTNAFYPEWHVWQSYITDTLDRALQLDSLRSSHPIDMPLNTASDILQIFDAISYSKGSCLIRMISKYLGEEVFMEGMRRYLKKYAWSNTQNNDLWAALGDASGEEVTKIMEVWTKKVGYPVITVTESENGIEVQQSRFLQTGDATPEEDSTIYPVLLTLSTTKGASENILFNQRKMLIPLQDLKFFKFNISHSGIYRTLYTPERLFKLGESMSLGLLAVEDRIGLVSDTAALAASGYQKTSALLGLLASLKGESNSIVWGEIVNRLSSIQRAWRFEPPETQVALKHFIRDLVSPKALALGWDFNGKDDMLQQQHKVTMFRAAGLAGDEVIVNISKKMLSSLVKGDKTAIHPNLRGAVYAIAFQDANESDFDTMLNILHSTSTTIDEHEDILRGVGYFRNPKIIQKVLDLVLSNETKSQNYYSPLLGLAESPQTAVNVWTWAKVNMTLLDKKSGQGMSSAGRTMLVTTRGLATFAQQADVREFYKGRPDEAAKIDQKLAQALDGIGARAMWVQRDADDVVEWLKSKGYFH